MTPKTGSLTLNVTVVLLCCARLQHSCQSINTRFKKGPEGEKKKAESELYEVRYNLAGAIYHPENKKSI